MTDVSHPSALAVSTGSTRAAGTPWHLLPYVLVFAAGASGRLIGRAMGGDADAFESKLLLLLRFMAGMKLLGVLAAAGVLHWRLTYPIGSRVAFLYLATLVPMAAAAGLIFSLGGIAIGALLFHIGLLAFLYLAWKDDGVHLPRRR